MKIKHNMEARKCAVNLTLNEDLVVQVRGLTNNLPGVGESFLSGYVAHEQRQRLDKAKALESTISLWNDFNAKRSSIADEYSTL